MLMNRKAGDGKSLSIERWKGWPFSATIVTNMSNVKDMHVKRKMQPTYQEKKDGGFYYMERRLIYDHLKKSGTKLSCKLDGN